MRRSAAFTSNQASVSTPLSSRERPLPIDVGYDVFFMKVSNSGTPSVVGIGNNVPAVSEIVAFISLTISYAAIVVRNKCVVSVVTRSKQNQPRCQRPVMLFESKLNAALTIATIQNNRLSKNSCSEISNITSRCFFQSSFLLCLHAI